MSGGATLTEAMITRKTGKRLDEITKLNMWSYGLRDVSIVEKLPNLEIASLSVNKIRTLEPFSKCPNLKVLFLRSNEIVDFAELKHLQELKHLKAIWLLENPIAQHEKYRELVAQMLPNLIKLDEAELTEFERPESPIPIPEPFPAPRTSHLKETFPDLEVESPIEEPKSPPRPRPPSSGQGRATPSPPAQPKPTPQPKPAPQAKPSPQPKASPQAKPSPQAKAPAPPAKPQAKPQTQTMAKTAPIPVQKSTDKAIVNAILMLLPELSEEGLAAVGKAVMERQKLK